MKGIRHGDLAFIQVKVLPKGLKASKTKVLMENGSGGHTHSFQGGMFYPKVEGEFIIGYLKAKDTKLYHPEHGKKQVGSLKEAEIGDGVYEVRRQVEFTHDGMRQVID